MAQGESLFTHPVKIGSRGDFFAECARMSPQNYFQSSFYEKILTLPFGDHRV